MTTQSKTTRRTEPAPFGLPGLTQEIVEEIEAKLVETLNDKHEESEANDLLWSTKYNALEAALKARFPDATEAQIELAVDALSCEYVVRPWPYATKKAQLIADASPELHALALDIYRCTADGKPWDQCDRADLLDCLESFTRAARAALKKAGTLRKG